MPWRAGCGIVRVDSSLQRTSPAIAHERSLSFVDEHIMSAAIDDPALTQLTANVAQAASTPSTKPRSHSETTSR